MYLYKLLVIMADIYLLEKLSKLTYFFTLIIISRHTCRQRYMNISMYVYRYIYNNIYIYAVTAMYMYLILINSHHLYMTKRQYSSIIFVY